MARILTYRKDTGDVLTMTAIHLAPGQEVVVFDGDLTGGLRFWYIEDGEVKARPSIEAKWDMAHAMAGPDNSAPKARITADGKDEAVLSGLPIPCEVRINGGAPQIVADGTLEITADTDDDYQIDVTAAPYLPAQFFVETVMPT